MVIITNFEKFNPRIGVRSDEYTVLFIFLNRYAIPKGKKCIWFVAKIISIYFDNINFNLVDDTDILHSFQSKLHLQMCVLFIFSRSEFVLCADYRKSFGRYASGSNTARMHAHTLHNLRHISTNIGATMFQFSVLN